MTDMYMNKHFGNALTIRRLTIHCLSLCRCWFALCALLINYYFGITSRCTARWPLRHAALSDY